MQLCSDSSASLRYGFLFILSVSVENPVKPLKMLFGIKIPKIKFKY